MLKEEVQSQGVRFPIFSVNTLIIGSGAAALNTALRLFRLGQKNIAIVTEEWGGGTSSNSGSDKQTYYKLSLAGSSADSAQDMAADLFRGGCMHGDIALCEAQNSAQAFLNLVDIGVPFPHDRYGGFVGYKTDHDPLGRGTSAGPLTSRWMFSCLAQQVEKREIPVFDQHDVITLLTLDHSEGNRVIGAIALNKNRMDDPSLGLVVFSAVNVVLASGGPAGIYKTSVYPEGHTGAHGLAFYAGAAAQNLTESQYGIASTKFRWNLSGTYQQVIPRYVSTAPDGSDLREFLNDHFPDMGTLASAIFLKGYQWPFDPRKVAGFGSSLIDILVYRESVILGRRVFLDFRQNPGGGGRLQDFALGLLAPEAYKYLERSGALLDIPIARLCKMNQPAIELFRSHGINISEELLEIAVCAQHNNGGFRGNIWWESNLGHLFPVGEVSGTHGVYRPGGSALNSGQVGGMRAALFISKRYAGEPPAKQDFWKKAGDQIKTTFAKLESMIDKDRGNMEILQASRANIQERMTAVGSHIRDPKKIRKALKDAWDLFRRMETMKIPSSRFLPFAFRNRDICLTHVLFLEAMEEYLERGGASRGSYLVVDPEGELPCQSLDDQWRFRLAGPGDVVNQKILEIRLEKDMSVRKDWVDVRSIPSEDTWFENVWNAYLRDEIVRS